MLCQYSYQRKSNGEKIKEKATMSYKDRLFENKSTLKIIKTKES